MAYGICRQNCTLFKTREDTCLHCIYSGFFCMSHSCILVQPTPAYLFHFQDGKHFTSTTSQATLQILSCPRQSPTENVHVLHPQTKEKLKAASYVAGKVSVVDPLLKLGDAQQSAGRAWRALHWAAGRGELRPLSIQEVFRRWKCWDLDLKWCRCLIYDVSFKTLLNQWNINNFCCN